MSRVLTVGSFPAIWHSSILLVDAGQNTWREINSTGSQSQVGERQAEAPSHPVSRRHTH